ncbi:type I polyketide synthase [Actinocrispum sp. NPDC049592]|uniref:type I polyketide synthase n=1 Tax=Actinocrispum sp. NPDC049592 TaxID=3154835 RepID=UPI003416727B
MDNEEKLRYFLKKVTADLHETRQRLRAAESGEHEPVAIVGMACRFPGGADTPQALWELLSEGRDVIGEAPGYRCWDAKVFDVGGPAGPRLGGFLDDAGQFDPSFFGISPREAVVTDPQQRLLLQIVWEALERAGIDPTALRGSKTGVFTGSNGLDYTQLAARTPGAVDYMYTANSASALSGRISYILGFEGPAFTVDTACSSSLVALHLAAQALRAGECSIALAGGASVMATPHVFLGMGKQGGLSSDGRCRAFAESADGTNWGEGAGILVLERLSDAQRNGHEVLAVIRGSAINQDGASNGFTAPNGPSQQRVIRSALASAGLAPADVDAVEAHGTATSLGDPIEADALLATYGQNRTGEPLWLGSIKSNMAHTQAAAGVAGVMKMVLAIQNGVLPKTLHVDAPTSAVDWSTGSVSLLAEARPWPETGRPRRAGVSSFGVSGTNSHVIIEQAPAAETPEPGAAPGVLSWTLSAKSAEALKSQAAKLLSFVEESADLSALDVGYSLATTRAAHPYRAAVVGTQWEEFLAGLAAIESGKPARGVVKGVAKDGQVAFLFTGQGSQRIGMGRELHAAHPAFAAAWDGIMAEYDKHFDRSVQDIIWGDDQDLLNQTMYAQAGLFALEVSLFRLLDSWGVKPDYLLGHSIGELAAAHIAGILSLEDACALVFARGRLMQALPAGGAMLAVQGTEAEIRPLLTSGLSIAAVNGPASVVVSGVDSEIDALRAALADRKTKRLHVSHAFHSALTEPMLAEFEQLAGRLTYAAPSIPVISNVTGESAGERLRDPAYWASQVRSAVRFDDGVQWLADRGVTRFVELGPDGTLTAMAREGLGENAVCVPVLRPDRPEARTVVSAVSELHVNGVSVDWQAIQPGRRVDLPTYAFQNENYWVDIAALADAGAGGDASSLGLDSAEHPLLAAVVPSPDSGGMVLTGRVSAAGQPWIADNEVLGKTLLPGSGLMEIALRAGAEVGCSVVEELTLAAPLVVPERGAVRIQVAVGEEDNGRRSVRIHSRAGDSWTLHAEGAVRAGTSEPLADLTEWPPAGAVKLDIQGAYAEMAEAGFRFGPVFQGLKAVWTCGEEAYAEVALPADTPVEGFGLHPALMDATTHLAMLVSIRKNPAAAKAFRPAVFNDVTLHSTGASSLRVKMAHLTPETLEVTAAVQDGRPVFSCGSLLGQMVSAAEVVASDDDVLFRIEWKATPSPITNDIESSTWDELGDTVPDVVVLEFTSDGEGPDRPTLYRAVDVLQTWLAEERFAKSKLVVVTRNAVALTEGQDVDVTQAPVWGLVRSAQAENPGRFVLLDLDRLDELAWFLAPAVASGEPEVAVRNLEMHVPRLVRAEMPAVEPGVLNPDGTVLITGGTGGLGGLVAERLVTRHGVQHLLLTSRRGSDAPGTAELKASLEALGAAVTVTACDVSSRDAVAELLASVPAEHPLTGVVHAAGVASPGLLGTLSRDKWEPVLQAKADSAWHLHSLTMDLDLGAFVLFSSAGGMVLAAGHANYAAANVFLDALAAHRQAKGLAATSVAYGVWDGAGAGQFLNEVQMQRMRRQGLPALSAEDGLKSFDAAVVSCSPVLVSLRVDIAALRSRTDETPALLRELAKSTKKVARNGGLDASAVKEKLDALGAEERAEFLTDLVRDMLAAVLEYSSGAEIEPDRNFGELGIDSLTAAELRNLLADVTGLRLPTTLVYDYPTPEAVAVFVASQLTPAEPEADSIDAMAEDDLLAMAFAAAGAEKGE